MQPRVVLIASRKPLMGQDADEFVINVVRREIWRNGCCLKLPRMQFRYVAAVMSACGNAATYDDLFQAIWGESEDGGPLAADKALFVTRRRLHSRLALLGAEIGTRWGYGHFLIAHPVQALAMAA